MNHTHFYYLDDLFGEEDTPLPVVTERLHTDSEPPTLEPVVMETESKEPAKPVATETTKPVETPSGGGDLFDDEEEPKPKPAKQVFKISL